MSTLLPRAFRDGSTRTDRDVVHYGVKGMNILNETFVIEKLKYSILHAIKRNLFNK